MFKRFKSRIVRRLNRDGSPVASSPITTGWQHSFSSEYDTVCQRLPLDSPPDGASQSHSNLGDPETPPTPGDATPELGKQEAPSTPSSEKNPTQQNCIWVDSGGAGTETGGNRLQPFAGLEKTPSMHFSQPEPQMVMAIPGLQDNYYLSPLAWGGRSLVALALGSSVALWSGETQRLLGSVHLKPPASTCSRNLGLFTSTCSVTSVSWSRDGSTIALGTGDGEIQLWDVERSCKLRSISGHLSQVGALAWNQHLLSSGSLLGSLHHHDVRAGPPVGVARLQKCVCGLEWSPSGQRLASGTTDGLLCIWPDDPGAAGRNKPISTIPHPTAVKALGWCPWKSELVAVGGGRSDGMLRIWDTNTETCLESTATNSQICSLRWSSRRKELLTAHGLPHNQIIRWAYPTLAQQAQLQGHTGRVLHMALSPCESWILSCGSDQQACLWSSKLQDDLRPESPSAHPNPGALQCVSAPSSSEQ
ncbi:hypothetical protein AGOR_G00046530 [Albula goreensis]|uniref:CDC20/Fizzy WD40 domain-containing protein n=1 Tax=Albula goreensis TaxID=1534307 RepID=A0A8T3DZK5_9TELE|nr:hypothetical protein AGOR_G00046530 [Albula goreensis]